MIILTRFALFLTLLTAFLATPVLIFASDQKETGFRFSMSLGWEQMVYKEEVPEISLKSKATISNLVFDFEGLKSWRNIFVGIKGVLPLAKNDDREEWSLSGILDQINSLEYGWTRIDGFLGYPLSSFLNPYIGLRWSEARQERSDFVDPAGPPIPPLRVTETISSYHFLLGVRGNILTKTDWTLSYGAEYLRPFSSEVENSALPGWQVSDADGYTLALHGQLEYLLSKKISLAVQLNGGRLHWDGSNWQPYGGGLVKWPENDTDFWGGMIVIKKDF